ncbi:ParB N-terminal domain-containing protein [Gammaproteobacteria bacterium]|nr:ParB N-terminal domain-containing protein [Gammaproteobacteria bacterium]
MTKKKRFGVSQALSKGLTETINVVENNSGIFRNVIIPLSRIELDPDNPRKLFISLSDVINGIDKNDPLAEQKNIELLKLQELAQTIISSGIINPIVAYKNKDSYRVVAGERRCLASILAKKNEIEARVYNEKPKGFELKLIQWIENTARENLSLEERINNIKDILIEYKQQNSNFKLTATLLKNITGLSLSQSTYYISVLNAPEDVKFHIENGDIKSLDKAAIICSIDSVDLRNEVIEACILGCSLKDLRRKISSSNKLIKSINKQQINKKPGRAITKINMGSTLNYKIIKTIVESVIKNKEYSKYANIFADINWSQLDQASKAFNKLIDILEHEPERK